MEDDNPIPHFVVVRTMDALFSMQDHIWDRSLLQRDSRNAALDAMAILWPMWRAICDGTISTLYDLHNR
jgi:hypothetical protein